MVEAGAADTFKARYEAVDGHVHLCADAAAAADRIVAVLGEAGARRVATAGLQAGLARLLAERCAAAGIELVAPPYDATSLPGALDGLDAGVAGAAFAIAETGTLVEVTTDDADRLVSTLPPLHVGVVDAAELLPRLDDAAPRIRRLFEEAKRHLTVGFVSGPSRTGDIEMRLTLGVHGPRISHAVVIGAR